MLPTVACSAARLVAVPRVLDVSRGAIDRLVPTLVDAEFALANAVVVTGPGPTARTGERVAAALRSAGYEAVIVVATQGSYAEAEKVGKKARADGATLLLAVGGGRVIDTAKKAGQAADLDVISIPTSIANDGLSSPIAALTDAAGRHTSVSARMPAGVVVDVDVAASAPTVTLRAGLGDLLSNITAVLDWRLAHDQGQDSYDAYAALIAEAAATPALGIRSLRSIESLELLARGLVLSGLAMATAGTSRPCSGSEHLFSHALDQMLGSGARLHGEQVALGTLLTMTAHGRSTEQLHEVFMSAGLPTHPSDLDLQAETIVEALLLAPSTRPDRFTVLSRLQLDERQARALVERTFLLR